MKRMTLIMIILLGTFAIVSRVNEDYVPLNEDDVLQQAGQEALAAQETILAILVEDINEYLREAAADRNINRKEMRALIRLVRKFRQAQDQANRHLKIYGLTVMTDIPEIKMAIDNYTKPLLYHRDKDGNVRVPLIKAVGHDLTVEGQLARKPFVILVILATIGLIGMIFGRKESTEKVAYILTVVSFIGMIIYMMMGILIKRGII